MLDANMYLYFLKIIQPSQEEHFKHQPNIYIGPCPTWSLLCLCPTILTSNSTKPSADTFRHMVCLFLFCFFNLFHFFYCYRFQICFDWSDHFFFKWLRDAAKFLHNWSILAYKWTPRQAKNKLTKFSWLTNFVFWIKFHWRLFLRVQLTMPSTLVQVMAWCRQAASHYLRQCQPRSLNTIRHYLPQCFQVIVWKRWTIF